MESLTSIGDEDASDRFVLDISGEEFRCNVIHLQHISVPG